MSEFEREERYSVIKLKRLSSQQHQALREFLDQNMIPTEECVVVESDWPNYEHVWDTVEQVSNGTFGEEQDPDEGREVTFEVYQCHPNGHALVVSDEDSGYRLAGPKVTGASDLFRFTVKLDKLVKESRAYSKKFTG